MRELAMQAQKRLLHNVARSLLVDAPTAPVSSTEIRRRVAEGAPIHDLVPAAVAEYIKTHGLYVEKS